MSGVGVRDLISTAAATLAFVVGAVAILIAAAHAWWQTTLGVAAAIMAIVYAVILTSQVRELRGRRSAPRDHKGSSS